MMLIGISVEEQTGEFVLAILCGLAIGAVYDALYILRNLLPFRRAADFACDCLFWSAVCAATFVFHMSYMNGAVRWYSAAGMCGGFALWRASVGALIRRISKRLGNIRIKLKKILQKRKKYKKSTSHLDENIVS